MRQTLRATFSLHLAGFSPLEIASAIPCGRKASDISRKCRWHPRPLWVLSLDVSAIQDGSCRCWHASWPALGKCDEIFLSSLSVGNGCKESCMAHRRQVPPSDARLRVTSLIPLRGLTIAYLESPEVGGAPELDTANFSPARQDGLRPFLSMDRYAEPIKALSSPSEDHSHTASPRNSIPWNHRNIMNGQQAIRADARQSREVMHEIRTLGSRH